MDAGTQRPPTYEEDLYAWAHRQAELLRSGRLDELDIDNVAEEIESLGRSQASSLQSSFRSIALHLLKALHQPERITTSWKTTILRERLNAAECLRENPSLIPRSDELFGRAYAQARKLAGSETGLPVRGFPADPPFTFDELMSETYAPYDTPTA